MKIGLIDIDSHNFPNLALMKISAHHKAQMDDVVWWHALEHYDIVYKAKVFDNSYSADIDDPNNTDCLIKGGTGYGLGSKLLKGMEHMYPDYSIYPNFTEAYGFLTRGCPRNCSFCIVSKKEGCKSVQVAELPEFWKDQKVVKLLDPNLLACKDHEKILQNLIVSKAKIDFTQGLDARLLNSDNIALLQKVRKKLLHFAWDNDKNSDLILNNLQKYKTITNCHSSKAIVYILTNFDMEFEFDLYRVNTLRQLGFNPYVMIYDKPNAPQKVKHLQRWVNNRIIWGTVDKFEDYKSL